MNTHSLADAANIICGDDTPASLHWLAMRLRHRSHPFLDGYKSRGRWRMTDEQVTAALDILTPKHVDIPDIPSTGGMMRRSRRRLAS